jgi:hypothetical protein
MKYLKMLALAAVAAGALMAFAGAGTASATVLCSTTVTPCPAGQSWPANTVLDFSIPSGGSAVLKDTNGNELDKCTSSTVEGKITNAGSSTTTVTGSFEEPNETTGLTWGGCTWTTKTTSTGGKLEVHNITGTSNGTVTADSKISVTIFIGLFNESCQYGVEPGTSVGDITEGSGTGAVFHANANATRFVGVLCPKTAVWTGTYVLTGHEGTTLSVEPS